MSCMLCDPLSGLERVRYFSRQLLTADDMRIEQEYFRQKLRRHNRFLHGWGVVCGCEVEAVPTTESHWQIRVFPGFAVSPQGDDILINDCVLFDLKSGVPQPQPCAVKWPCPPEGEMPSTKPGHNTVFLAVRYAEYYTRPVRVHPAGCGCDETQCEYSRIHDSFELKLLWKLPESHENAAKVCQDWCATLKNHTWNCEGGLPVPPCPECVDDPWIVLATISLPQSITKDINQNNITYIHRRALWSTTAIQVALNCTRTSTPSPSPEPGELLRVNKAEVVTTAEGPYNLVNPHETLSVTTGRVTAVAVEFNRFVDPASVTWISPGEDGGRASFLVQRIERNESGEILTAIPGTINWSSAQRVEYRFSDRGISGGTYRVTLFGNEEPGHSHPAIRSRDEPRTRLDGDPTQLPSGNGQEGGDFVFEFFYFPPV